MALVVTLPLIVWRTWGAVFAGLDVARDVADVGVLVGPSSCAAGTGVVVVVAGATPTTSLVVVARYHIGLRVEEGTLGCFGYPHELYLHLFVPCQFVFVIGLDDATNDFLTPLSNIGPWVIYGIVRDLTDVSQDVGSGGYRRGC